MSLGAIFALLAFGFQGVLSEGYVTPNKFNFPAGDLQDDGSVSERHKEIEPKQRYINMKTSVGAGGIIDWFAFEFPNDGDILKCTIGANFGLSGEEIVLEDTKCDPMDGKFSEKYPDTEEFAHIAEYGEKIDFNTGESFVHCKKPSFKCRTYLGQNNVVYVQKSIHKSRSQSACRRKCNRLPHCKFWTYSAMKPHDEDHHHHNHTRVKRNHDGGVPECGIRRYRVKRSSRIDILRPVPGFIPPTFEQDKHQRCGLKGDSRVYYGQVFVQKAFHSHGPGHCAWRATQPATGQPFKHWMFWTFSYGTKKCVLARYNPHRSIQLPTEKGTPVGVVSGIVHKKLLANWDKLEKNPHPSL